MAVVALAVATPASGGIKLLQLADDRFLISHKALTTVSGEAKMHQRVMRDAGALCHLLGFTHFQTVDREGGRGGWYTGSKATATLEVDLFHEDGDERLDCERLADEKSLKKM
jgi:hypothetical protein